MNYSGEGDLQTVKINVTLIKEWVASASGLARRGVAHFISSGNEKYVVFGDETTTDGVYMLGLVRNVRYRPGGAPKPMMGIAVQRIWVNDAQRRKGVATQLLQAVETAARDYGLDFVLVQAVQSEAMVELMAHHEPHYQMVEYNNPWGDHVLYFTSIR